MPPKRLSDDTLTKALPGWLAIHPAKTGETRSRGPYPTPEEITRHCGHGPFGYTQARLCGFKFYWPGRPCRHNHHAVRFASNGTCTGCLLERWSDPEWSERERNRVREAKRAFYARQRMERAMDEIAGDLDLS